MTCLNIYRQEWALYEHTVHVSERRLTGSSIQLTGLQVLVYSSLFTSSIKYTLSEADKGGNRRPSGGREKAAEWNDPTETQFRSSYYSPDYPSLTQREGQRPHPTAWKALHGLLKAPTQPTVLSSDCPFLYRLLLIPWNHQTLSPLGLCTCWSLCQKNSPWQLCSYACYLGLCSNVTIREAFPDLMKEQPLPPMPLSTPFTQLFGCFTYHCIRSFTHSCLSPFRRVWVLYLVSPLYLQDIE